MITQKNELAALGFEELSQKELVDIQGGGFWSTIATVFTILALGFGLVDAIESLS